MWGPGFLRISGAHMHSRFLAKKRGGFLKMALPINHPVQFLQKKRSSGPISAKKKVNKKKGEEWICGADLFSGTNIDNEIEKRSFHNGVPTFIAKACSYFWFLLLEMPKLAQKLDFGFRELYHNQLNTDYCTERILQQNSMVTANVGTKESFGKRCYITVFQNMDNLEASTHHVM